MARSNRTTRSPTAIRTLIATDEKIDRVCAADPDPKRLKIIDMGQRTCQDLPKSLLNKLAARAAKHNVCIVCALVDEGPLEAVVWTPDLWVVDGKSAPAAEMVGAQ